MISKTIGIRGTLFSDTPILSTCNWQNEWFLWIRLNIKSWLLWSSECTQPKVSKMAHQPWKANRLRKNDENYAWLFTELRFVQHCPTIKIPKHARCSREVFDQPPHFHIKPIYVKGFIANMTRISPRAMWSIARLRIIRYSVVIARRHLPRSIWLDPPTT